MQRDEDRQKPTPPVRRERRTQERALVRRELEAWEFETALFMAQIQEDVDGRKGVEA